MARRKSEFGGSTLTALAPTTKIAAYTSVVPMAKSSPLSSPLLTTPVAPASAGYVPSTSNVGAPTPNAYQDIAKVPTSIPFVIPSGIAMPGAGGLKGSGLSAPSQPGVAPPAPYVPPGAPPPIVAPYSQPSPDPGQGQGGGGGGGSSPDYQANYQGSYQAAPAPPVSPSSPLALPPIAPISQPASTPPNITTTPVTATPTASPSVWTRILRFFGFRKAPATPSPQLSAHGDASYPVTETQEQAVISLVRRARAGDQNAMATLDLVGKNARAGNARAERSRKIAMAYIDAHPVGANMGGEGAQWEAIADATIEDPTFWDAGIKGDPLFTDAVVLSFGPPLTDDAILGYASQFGGEEAYAFAEGMRYAAPLGGASDPAVHASVLGATMSIARRLQQVRLPGADLKHFDPRIAAEIG